MDDGDEEMIEVGFGLLVGMGGASGSGVGNIELDVRAEEVNIKQEDEEMEEGEDVWEGGYIKSKV